MDGKRKSEKSITAFILINRIVVKTKTIAVK